MTTPTQHAELNAIAAEKVMGWKVLKSRSRAKAIAFKTNDDREVLWVGEERLAEAYECDHPENEMFHPTTNDADAFAVWRVCLKKTKGSLETTIVTDGSVRISEDGINPVWGETLNLAIVKCAIAFHGK